MLHRSASANAVATLRRRSRSFSSVSGQTTGRPFLRRTLSQSSNISMVSSLNSNQKLRDESFNEFWHFLSGDEYYGAVNSLWDKLPQDTKDIFVAKVVQKRRSTKWTYEDVGDLFTDQAVPTKNSFMHYRRRVSPYFRNNAPGIRESVISKTVADIYNNELTDEERLELKREAEHLRAQTLAERIEIAQRYVELNTRGLDADPFLAEVRQWREENRSLAPSVQQVNSLVEKLDLGKAEPAVAVAAAAAAKPSSFVGELTAQSRKLLNKFKSKSKKKRGKNKSKSKKAADARPLEILVPL
ncbi:uncharacterized protein KNAG_0C05460 [Huiozyma naganishii CBS 8797]|uniref:Uncharacterized protein n=1 Tax=Huiozyma naganishii (strain ATCC MYA-139 / BCRC 22969 / CBS 8797 / KCTC 17520 / NBRC 10181 / NCYC 3082 / Yp74L-3) TaxID=1071383 RepID=J7S539_HUIN7|nr:hypothetical protein KNAG_0C05460 [Kazachstania naganishii CBS 8797]CCK69644.1 hypothetical protein KNAG_0C05460 [Kazachstania naganishii CBS 8797]